MHNGTVAWAEACRGTRPLVKETFIMTDSMEPKPDPQYAFTELANCWHVLDFGVGWTGDPVLTGLTTVTGFAATVAHNVDEVLADRADHDGPRASNE